PPGWENPLQLNLSQEIGSCWYSSGRSPVLKVPSALVAKENNFVIHTLHPDFINIKIFAIEDFYFDSRFL
ncbi:MAG: RES family NAD+ phosphorylase, partial [Bacteroidota bacterium]